MTRRLLAEPRFYQAPADPGAGPIPAGVHVVRGDSPGGALKSAGAKRLVAVPDDLAVGPSSRSVRLHPKIRERFWRAEAAAMQHPHADELGDVGELVGADAVIREVGADDPIYLWCSGFWSDLLFLGWLLDASKGGGPAWDAPMLAGDLRQSMPLGWWNPDQLYPLARAARPLPANTRAELIEVWRAYTEPSPTRLEYLRQKPPESLPTLVEGLAAYASRLPRRLSRARRLRLPAVDEVLFRLIPSRRGVRFPDLFKGSSPSRARWPRSGLFAMISYFGDLFIHSRIASWTVGADRAIDVIPDRRAPDDPYPMRWRLTDRGRALLADGLDGPEDCPEQIIGGYRTGRGEDWCCAITASGWRLAPCS